MSVICALTLFAACHHAKKHHPAPDPVRAADMVYIQSVYDHLPAYTAAEMDARFEREQINQVLADLAALDYLGTHLHEQVEKLRRDVGTLKAWDIVVQTQDFI